jgi:hypothetical protein
MRTLYMEKGRISRRALSKYEKNYLLVGFL